MNPLIFKFVNEKPYGGEGKVYLRPRKKLKFKKTDAVLLVPIPWYTLYTYNYKFEIEIKPFFRQIPIFSSDQGSFGVHNWVMFNNDLLEQGEEPTEESLSCFDLDRVPKHVAVTVELPIPREYADFGFHFRINVSQPYLFNVNNA